jgi:hypothetical protein
MKNHIDNEHGAMVFKYKTHHIEDVATLALGSQPRQGFAMLQAEREAQESHRMLPRV